jgi:hypothetical protein
LTSIDLGGETLTGSYVNQDNAPVTLANGRGQVKDGLLVDFGFSSCQMLWSLTPR